MGAKKSKLGSIGIGKVHPLDTMENCFEKYCCCIEILPSLMILLCKIRKIPVIDLIDEFLFINDDLHDFVSEIIAAPAWHHECDRINAKKMVNLEIPKSSRQELETQMEALYERCTEECVKKTKHKLRRAAHKKSMDELVDEIKSIMRDLRAHVRSRMEHV